MQELQDGWKVLNFVNENKGYVAIGAVLIPTLAVGVRRLYLVIDALLRQNATNWGIGLEDKLKGIPQDLRLPLGPAFGHIEKYLDESGDYRHADAFREVRRRLGL